MSSLVERIREMLPFLEKGCIITDAGSVKGPLVDEIDALMPESIDYVGAHPIAGGEQSGLEAARVDLLTGAKCIITPTAQDSEGSTRTGNGLLGRRRHANPDHGRS